MSRTSVGMATLRAVLPTTTISRLRQRTESVHHRRLSGVEGATCPFPVATAVLVDAAVPTSGANAAPSPAIPVVYPLDHGSPISPQVLHRTCRLHGASGRM